MTFVAPQRNYPPIVVNKDGGMRRESSFNSTIIPITVKNSAMEAPNTLVSVMAIQK